MQHNHCDAPPLPKHSEMSPGRFAMLAEETFDRNPRSATTLLSRCERLDIRHQPHLRGIVCGGHSCEPLIKLVEQLGDGRHSLERNISQ